MVQVVDIATIDPSKYKANCIYVKYSDANHLEISPYAVGVVASSVTVDSAYYTNSK